jgi:hypothetical protein
MAYSGDITGKPTYRAKTDLGNSLRVKLVADTGSDVEPPQVEIAGDGEADIGTTYSTVQANDLVAVRVATDAGGHEMITGSILPKFPTPLVGADNVGNGVLGTITAGSKIETGTYVLICTAAATDAGTFSVRSPSGELLPDLTVASAYSGDHINGTLADGATDFAVGDRFDIYVNYEVPIGTALYGAADGKVSDTSSGTTIGKNLTLIRSNDSEVMVQRV